MHQCIQGHTPTGLLKIGLMSLLLSREIVLFHGWATFHLNSCFHSYDFISKAPTSTSPSTFLLLLQTICNTSYCKKYFPLANLQIAIFILIGIWSWNLEKGKHTDSKVFWRINSDYNLLLEKTWLLLFLSLLCKIKLYYTDASLRQTFLWN